MYSCNCIIGNMRNEKYFYGYCKKSEYNHEFEKVYDVSLEFVYIIYFLKSL